MTDSSSASPMAGRPAGATARPHSRTRLGCLLALLGFAMAMTGVRLDARRQPPSPPTFHAGVDLVLVDVIVRDQATGKLVTNLTKDDFQIEDEGRPQSIASFAFVNLPEAPVASAAQPRPAPPNAATNDLGTGRLFLVVVDDIDIPFLETGPLRDLLHRFVDHHLQDGDQAAIVPVSDVEVAQGFTGDRARLDAIVDRLQGGILDVRPGQGSYDALGAIQGIAAAMTRVPARRKVLIFVGDHMWQSVLGSPAFNETVKIAAAGNVAIYPVDPFGVSATNFGDALRALATETGGVASITSNDFDGALTRIVNEAGTYYLLGFSPTDHDAKPGDLRRLKVTVRRPGLIVQARKAYVRMPPDGLFSPATAPIKAVATSALPVTGIPLQVHAACFANDGRTDSVVVTVSVGGETASLAGHTLEYAVVGADDHGRVTDTEQGSSKIPEADLLPDMHVVSVLKLKPGLTSVRAAVRSDDGHVGSVFLNLNVPALEEGRLALSDVELTSLSTRALVVGKPPGFLRQTLPDPPVVRRTFDDTETLAIYGELYGSGSPEATLLATIRDASGNVRHQTGIALHAEKRRSRRGPDRFSYGQRFDLSGLPAGAYTLRLEASDGDSHPATKAVPFTIGPP